LGDLNVPLFIPLVLLGTKLLIDGSGCI